MVSTELDNIIYAVSTSKEVAEPFKSALIRCLKSARDTARALEEKTILIYQTEENNNVVEIDSNAGIPSAA